MSRQLALDLRAAQSARRSDFARAPSNADALAAVERWPDWAAGKLALVGPPGSGKSHLARIWTSRSGATVLDAGALGEPPLPGSHVVIEGGEEVTANDAGARAVLHLHNLVLAEGGSLLLTARTPPARWTVPLPDLASRLAATPVVRIGAPDEALLAAVLVKHFTDRGLDVGPHVVRYIVARMERSLIEAARIAARLDAAALARGGPVTRRLAAEVVNDSGGVDGNEP